MRIVESNDPPPQPLCLVFHLILQSRDDLELPSENVEVCMSFPF